MQCLGRSVPGARAASQWLAVLAVLAATAALALSPARAADAATPAPATASAARAASAAGVAGPSGISAERRVIEDDGVRIEELHVRGEVRHVSVHSKVPGARSYEVLVRRGGRDPSQDRSGAGHSVWPLLSF